jgi:uncharacterized protein (TIGR00255 family)
LAKALGRVVREMEAVARKVRAQVPRLERRMQQRLSERIGAIYRKQLGEEPTRQAVLAQIADFVHSTDVREELDRIASHLEAVRRILSGAGGGAAKESPASAGRVLDFLGQELHREATTLAAKLRDTTVSAWVVRMKGQIEKLREQAANVE